ncbi:MAG: FAD-binding oxidoreductase [Kiloniellales bacterium]|nr:FAD-binding oxidoreductase [Kiloniellales bacterium]
MTQSIPQPAIEALKSAVGPKGWLESDQEKAAYLEDARQLYRGSSPLVVSPAGTAEVAAVVRICRDHGIGIVPQGGNTGYVGGSVPTTGGSEILVSLTRMNRIRDIDPLDYSMTVEAGCVLARIQEAAAEADRLFPLSLAAEGSCQIGGNLSTNAGGIAVLRYGNARDLVLGLEVVLPDGRVWDGLRRLRKDNTGYDMKQLFLGAEGTLGIITAAVLRLFPRPSESRTAFAAVADPGAATALLARFRNSGGDEVTSFEYLARPCIDFVLAHIPGTREPLAARFDHYVLIELSTSRADADLDGLMETVLGAAMESGEVLDASLSHNEAQARAFWTIRESVPAAQKHEGASIKHDVSVAVSRVPEFLARAAALAESAIPNVRVVPFGHLGDGNIHFNLSQPRDMAPEAFLGHGEAVTRRLHDLVAELDGSFSAEHGVGQLKRADLRRYRSEVELDMMASVKRALDPRGLMNPGKLL